MIEANLLHGTEILRRKDSEDDRRSAVTLQLLPTTIRADFMFPANGSVGGYPTPDPVIADDDAQELFDAAPNSTIIAVNYAPFIRGQAEGIGSWYNWVDEIIFDVSDYTPETLAHEVGHLMGLEHGDAPTVNHIMRSGLDRIPGATLLTEEEADAYD